MLAASRLKTAEGLEFKVGNINNVDLHLKVDLVFANGVLYYAQDPYAVLKSFRNLLAPRGQIAIQAPRNPDFSPIELCYKIARNSVYADYRGDILRQSSLALSPNEYAEILFDLKFEKQVVRFHAHSHRLESGQYLLDWLQQTHLLTFQSRLPADLFIKFLNEYAFEFSALIQLNRPYPYVLNCLNLLAQ